MSNAIAPVDLATLPRVKVPPPPEGACGCPSSSWWHDDVRCHEPAGHGGHHQGPARDAVMSWRPNGMASASVDPSGRLRTLSWAPRETHLKPCGCRLCSDAAPSPEVIDRVLAKAGPESSLEELIEGGFVVSVPLTRGPSGGVRAVLMLAEAGTVEGLAENLGA
jgi:hypothetical protein